jgi:flagellar basal-body rod protein FlgB
VFDSVTTNALTSALDGLALRQRTIAQNIANVNTPGYRAKVVSFEAALAASVQGGDGTAAATTSTSQAPVQQNGNNVGLDTETLNNIETVLRYQFASRAVDMDFDAAKAAMRTS